MNRLTGSVAILALSSASFVAAQEEAATFRSDTRLVVVHASVTDKNGKLLTNLPKSAFRVFENGVEQQIRRFNREDVPVSMGLVIDNSSSMRDKRAKVEAAAMSLVKASNPDDEVFIVNFNDDAFLDVPFTNDVKKLEAGVARIDSKGSTAMRDALSMSVDELAGKGKREKKVLLIVTDGNDNTSLVSLERLLEKVQRKDDVVIYCIGLLSEEEKREAEKARKALAMLASGSGGAAFFPKDLSEVEHIALDLAHEVRNQFMLAYSPSNQELDGTYRQIKVTVDGPGHPTARTRSGYYARPQNEKVVSQSLKE